MEMQLELRRNLFPACLLLFVFIVRGAAAGEKLVVRGSDGYPPFEYLNDRGEPEGFNVDIFNALMNELGYEYDLGLGNWDDIAGDIQHENIDAVLGMIYSPERAASVRFTLPTCVMNRNFITRKADGYESFDDLVGKEIIVEKGGWFSRYLRDSSIAGRIVEADDVAQGLKLLASGKHDALLTGDLVALYAIKKLGLKELRVGPMPIDPQNYGIAVSQGRDDLLYRFNLGLQRLKTSGVYDRIYNKWFGIYESRKNRQPLFIILGVFLFVMLWLGVFVWLLRRQVARATRLLTYARQEVGIAIDAGKISAWNYVIAEGKFNALHGHPAGLNGGTLERIRGMFHPEDLEAVRDEFAALCGGTKREAKISFRIRRDDASPYRYAETKMVRVEATREQPCRIVGTFKDVSEEVQMRQRLEDYRIKTDFIVNTNGIILIQYDIASRMFTRINHSDIPSEAAYDVTQYLARVHPDDLGIAVRFVEALDRAGEPVIETEFRIVAGKGSYDWFTITAVAYKYDAKGNITGYLGLRRNNTRWKTINNDLILLKEKADASNRLKSAFLANMSHEIRTPLNAIVGFSELIAETDDPEERAKFIEIVKTNNELLLQLINDVLDLSRIEAGHIGFSCVTFDFPAYFNDLYLSLKIKERDGVELVCVNRYDRLEICSDQNRISQVITNFVNNAFKFTSRGNVTLDYIYENDGIKVMVKDTGIGISDANRSRIFGRFEKVNDFAQGTGLGLSICREIIGKMGGTIGVDSEPGVGSVFWFWLPCNTIICEEPADTGLSEDDLLSEMAAFARSGETEGRKTVLIAEDIDNNFIIISAILKDRYRIVRAENGVEAVEKTRIYRPDIILMDMKMPLMNGLDATREIRKFDAQIPIVALTAYVFDTNRQDAINAGCNDFLTKPVNRSVLMQLLNDYE